MGELCYRVRSPTVDPMPEMQREPAVGRSEDGARSASRRTRDGAGPEEPRDAVEEGRAHGRRTGQAAGRHRAVPQHDEVPGGRLGRYRSLVVGAPEFVAGQRVILFLNGEAPGIPHLVGLGQGVYRIALRDAEEMVTPPALVSSSTASALAVTRGDRSRRTMRVVDFERQVSELIAGDTQ